MTYTALFTSKKQMAQTGEGGGVEGGRAVQRQDPEWGSDVWLEREGWMESTRRKGRNNTILFLPFPGLPSLP